MEKIADKKTAKEKEMNIVITLTLVVIGMISGAAFGYPIIGAIAGFTLSIMVNNQSDPALDRKTMTLVKNRTNSYLAEVWATLPALKRIEASNPEYAMENLKEIFNVHFPEELQKRILTSEEIIDLGKIIIVTEVKPLIQIKAFLKHSRKGLFKKNQDAEATIFHAGRIYARSGATPAMLNWLEAWSLDMGINPDFAYHGYLDEIHEQDRSNIVRLIDGNLEIDKRLDEIPNVIKHVNLGNPHNLTSRNTLYAEYRKSIQDVKKRAA